MKADDPRRWSAEEVAVLSRRRWSRQCCRYSYVILLLLYYMSIVRRASDTMTEEILCASPNSRARETVTTRAMEMAMTKTAVDVYLPARVVTATDINTYPRSRYAV